MPHDPSYQVVWSSKAKEAVRELGRQARTFGWASELARLVNTLNHRLQTQPLAVGKIYRSKGGVDEREAFEHSFGIDFAVDVPRQFVLVRNCWRVPESGQH
jgi:hypothetical protein